MGRDRLVKVGQALAFRTSFLAGPGDVHYLPPPPAAHPASRHSSSRSAPQWRCRSGSSARSSAAAA